MGSLNKFLLLFVLIAQFGNAQELTKAQLEQKRIELEKIKVEQKRINEYTQKANSLIWHINLNENKLIIFQQELNLWNSSKQNKTAPKFQFIQTISGDFVSTLSNNLNADPVTNKVFDYKKNIVVLYAKVTMFNNLCLQLQNTKYTINYYKDCMLILEQLDAIAKDFVDLSYDFSLSCAISFRKKDLNPDLEILKNIVGQSKNVIMSMRNENDIQLKSYLAMLDKALLDANKIVNLNILRREGEFRIGTLEMENYKKEIESTANEIANWAEQYLQSNRTEEELEVFLYNAVEAFNSSAQKTGSAGAYNNLVKQANISFLQYTEEPLPFYAKRTVSQIQVKKDAIQTENLLTKKEDLAPELNKPVVQAVFDAKNENTLEGAKINNIVFLMDVSPSMLKSGKFPLLKSSLMHLMNILRPEDNISLVAYSGEAKLLYSNAGIKDKMKIKMLLDTLESSGGTDLVKGLDIAYKTATKSFIPKENNKVIIATDGEFGVSPIALNIVDINLNKGISLSVIQLNNSSEEKKKTYIQNLVDTGGGNYRLMSNEQEAKTELMKEVKVK